MKISFIYLFLFLLIAETALATSFLKNDYVNVRQEGKVQVTCRDGIIDEYASFWCEGSYLEPENSAEFRTAKRNGLHHVRLVVENEAGRTTDTWKLNSLTGATWFNINLWGQNGILAFGENKIHYSIETSHDEVLEAGEFTTAVTTSPVRHCRPIWVDSSSSLDCQVPKFACSHLNGPRSECNHHSATN
ncbi:MAG: hypothetical protein RJB66_1377 [Pseudomonadota bacterium]|jgi:hypothetical protein